MSETTSHTVRTAGRSDLLAPLIRTVIAPAWARWERSSYLGELKRLRQTQFDAPHTIADRQWLALREMVLHAYETTVFFHNQCAAAGIDPRRGLTRDEFQRLPLLTKAQLRQQPDALLSSQYRHGPLRRKKTSGSTGMSVEVCVDEPAMQRKRAMTLRSDEWSGWRLGEPIARLWGAERRTTSNLRAWIRNRLLERSILLDTLNVDEQRLSEFVRRLQKIGPCLLFGHAHSLYLLATYLQERRMDAIRPKGILSTAMVLHDWERQRIEAVFDCRVTNRYGCEEVSLIACECEEHAGLHINSDGLFVEIVGDDGTPCQAGELGKVVVSDLVNRAMPILRYEVGDLAVMSDRLCPCGRGLPLLTQIAGRVSDYVVRPDGRQISGISLTDHFNTLIPGVVQMQIIQETLNRFTFRLVRSPDYGPASERRLQDLAQAHFGSDITYVCEFVDRIVPEPSGKYRFCISKVPRQGVPSA